MRAIVWFRSDLRVHDNLALARACRDATRGVVGVFTICPAQWAEHDWGPPRVDFLLRALASLSRSLESMNIALRVVETPRFAGVPGALLSLAEEIRADAIYYNREYEINEARRDAAVAAAFERSGRAATAFDDQTILPPGDVRTKAGGRHSVFTPFKKAWITRLEELGGVGDAHEPTTQTELVSKPDPIPEHADGFEPWRSSRDLWPADEAHARRLINEFISSRIKDYHDRRDAPAAGGTSRLSPHLAHGVISPRECLRAAINANAGAVVSGRGKGAGRNGPSVWISELIWREFYKHLLAANPKLSMGRAYQPATDRLRWADDDAGFDAWREGRTGFPIVDAAMRCLNTTGWMHNRLRMIVAMFLTKDLWIDWRRGEAHFMRRLIDGDLASNNGGWQWSASTGTDAAPYFRIYNPTTQGERHDPEATFIKEWIPELRDIPAAAAHDPSRLPPLARARLDYPDPICDHADRRERAIAAFRALKA